MADEYRLATSIGVWNRKEHNRQFEANSENRKEIRSEVRHSRPSSKQPQNTSANKENESNSRAIGGD
jgi:hypothetical protein